MRASIMFLTALCVLGCAGSARRQTVAAERADDRRDHRVQARTDWEKLGERWVDGRVDRDSIHVGRDDGRFRRVMFVAEHSALELFDIRIVFGDGSEFSPETRLIFAQNTRSRVVDLPGGARVIRRIDFRTGNLPGGGRAQLEVWAQ